MKRIVLSVFCVALVMAFIAAMNLEAGEQGKAKALNNTFKEPNLGYTISYCLIRSIRTLNPVLSERLFSNPFPAVSTL